MERETEKTAASTVRPFKQAFPGSLDEKKSERKRKGDREIEIESVVCVCVCESPIRRNREC